VRAVGSDVLVRLLARDDATQVRAAEAFIEGGALVTVLALAETLWVLESSYGLDAPRIATAVDMLLEHRQLVIQDTEVVTAARERFHRKPGIGFSDCLLLELARKAGHVPLGTFDRELGRMDGAVAI
jgi:predicted nucleic-acid-binding protein